MSYQISHIETVTDEHKLGILKHKSVSVKPV